ncbi:hypothetical protein Gohar_026885, partial [Gossypium harknessii]|nr:hypothetical protein [Gossypium harknessii]
FIRKSLSSPPYVVVRLFLLFSHQPVSRIHFDHPSVETVTKRFFNPNQPLNETTHAPFEAYRKLVMYLI